MEAGLLHEHLGAVVSILVLWTGEEEQIDTLQASTELVLAQRNELSLRRDELRAYWENILRLSGAVYERSIVELRPRSPGWSGLRVVRKTAGKEANLHLDALLNSPILVDPLRDSLGAVEHLNRIVGLALSEIASEGQRVDRDVPPRILRLFGALGILGWAECEALLFAEGQKESISVSDLLNSSDYVDQCFAAYIFEALLQTQPGELGSRAAAVRAELSARMDALCAQDPETAAQLNVQLLLQYYSGVKVKHNLDHPLFSLNVLGRPGVQRLPPEMEHLALDAMRRCLRAPKDPALFAVFLAKLTDYLNEEAFEQTIRMGAGLIVAMPNPLLTSSLFKALSNRIQKGMEFQVGVLLAEALQRAAVFSFDGQLFLNAVTGQAHRLQLTDQQTQTVYYRLARHVLTFTPTSLALVQLQLLRAKLPLVARIASEPLRVREKGSTQSIATRQRSAGDGQLEDALMQLDRSDELFEGWD